MQWGLILPLSELNTDLMFEDFRFGHDRIQQAAYTLIAPERKAEVHLRIGQFLWHNLSAEDLAERLFEVIDHLNHAPERITDQAERDQVAQLNLQGGQKAKSATAYQAAGRYLQTGLELLGPQGWHRCYALTLKLHEEAIEAAYLSQNYARQEQLTHVVLDKAHTVLDTVKVSRIEIVARQAQNTPLEAIDLGIETTRRLGLNLPPPSHWVLWFELQRTRLLHTYRSIPNWNQLPVMQDPEQLAIVQVLSDIVPSGYQASFAYYILSILKQVRLFFRYGNTSVSAFAYECYGLTLCGKVGDIESGYQFGRLGLEVVEKLEAKAAKSRAVFVFNGFVRHWKESLSHTVDDLHNGYQMGIETGDLEFGVYNLIWETMHRLLLGQELSGLNERLTEVHREITRLQQGPALLFLQAPQKAVALLVQETDPNCLTEGFLTQEVGEAERANNKHSLGWLYTFKSLVCYLMEDYLNALDSVQRGTKIADHIMGSAMVRILNFYDSLTRLALYPLLNKKTQRQAWQIVKANQKQLRKWAEHAPQNCQHQYLLVEAERARCLGKDSQAGVYYDQAIDLAQKHNFPHEAALANELAAKFYMGQHREAFALVYLREAYYGYYQWGAMAKVKHLGKNYPQLKQSLSATTSTATKFNPYVTTASSGSTDSESLDLDTVMKSTGAISSEIVLEKLLAALMDIIVENAGAQRGILMLQRSQGLFIEATKEENTEDVEVLQSLPLQKFKQLASKIVNYVARTRETIVLTDATNEGNFTEDTYIQEYECQSIACTPLMYRGNLQGIIYLENNLTTGAFTKDRMTLLQTLATQAAISLENAQLYKNITTLNRAYARFVPNQLINLLAKESIVEVKLGDQIQSEMTILFSDIRDFTSISEKMTPAENFSFINEYLGHMEPLIEQHGGFIDKYIGDAIMALFPHSADDALKGALAMLKTLKKYNQMRLERELIPIRIGIGLHTGSLMLGTVGGADRMDGTAIGDAVNLSSRVEGLTKTYGASLLITYQTLAQLKKPSEYDLRFVEQVKAKGKSKAVDLFEVYSADSPELREAKNAMRTTFDKAVGLYRERSWQDAAELFQKCVDHCAGDRAAHSYLDRCHQELSK